MEVLLLLGGGRQTLFSHELPLILEHCDFPKQGYSLTNQSVSLFAGMGALDSSAPASLCPAKKKPAPPRSDCPHQGHIRACKSRSLALSWHVLPHSTLHFLRCRSSTATLWVHWWGPAP